MKRLLLLSAMLGYSFVSNSLFSSGGVSPRNTIDPYCGFDDINKECRMVTEGSVCITYEDCKELDVNTDNPVEP